jgi:hypothetical protein
LTRIRRLALPLACAAGLAVPAAASAAVTPASGNWSGVIEGKQITFTVSSTGKAITEMHFVNRCFDDPQAGVGVPDSIPIQTTTRPRKRRGHKRPKPKPLPEPIFRYGAHGFTIAGKFTSATDAEGTARWVNPAGCDTGTLSFVAQQIVVPT